MSVLVDNLKQRQTILKRDQIVSSILEDAPRSFTKLMSKELSNNFHSEERIKTFVRNSTANDVQARAKHAQKTFFKALEEEQRSISRENMQLLGLTIQKIGYVPKGKGRRGSLAQGKGGRLQGEAANFENIQFPQSMMTRRAMSNQRPRAPKSRASSIRIRPKQPSSSANSPQRRRYSLKPPLINTQYQNPVYQSRILSYREFLFKMQWSYGMHSQMDRLQQFKNDKKYKVWIGGGNNCMLVRELMKRRFWWVIVEEKNGQDLQFMWTQIKVGEFFGKQEKNGLWENNVRIRRPSENKVVAMGTREGSRELIRSRIRRERQRQWLKDQQYLSKIMPQFQISLFQSSMRPYRTKPLSQRQRLLAPHPHTPQSQRMHNHLTSNFHLGNKKALFYNLKQYYQLTGGNLFKTIPLTFHIKKGQKDPQYKRFLAYYRKRQQYIKKMQGQGKKQLRNIWIVKPGQLTNRGNGITVIDQIYQLDAIIKAQKKHQNGSQKTFIVQLYIDRPFLYRRRKFDIRHYLLISHINGVMKAYWHKQGYIRTSSYEFDIYNFDREIHLTNDAVQKYTPLYGRYQQGNKVSYGEFQKYLDGVAREKKEKRLDFQESILPRMKEIALDAVRSTFVKISPQRLNHNFQIFGLDFMIDHSFTPWLIQVNTNPCLQLSSPLLSRIIPQMLDQAFRLTLDIIFPPPASYPNTSKHLVPDASLQSLRWQLFFDQRVEGEGLRKVYGKGRDVMVDIGEVQEDQVFQDNGNNNGMVIDNQML